MKNLYKGLVIVGIVGVSLVIAGYSLADEVVVADSTSSTSSTDSTIIAIVDTQETQNVDVVGDNTVVFLGEEVIEPQVEEAASDTTAVEVVSVDVSTGDSNSIEDVQTDDAQSVEVTTASETTDTEVLPPPPAPELSTDKPDYHPGETATIFGKFFNALQTYTLKIFGGSTDDETYTETNTEVTTDDQGNFIYNYVLDNVYRPLYNVVASTLGGDKVAETTFTDAINLAINPDQCRQGGVSNPQTFL